MMNSAESTRPMLRVLLTWASLVVIIAGMKAATELVVPFLLSLFLAIMSGPALQALQKRATAVAGDDGRIGWPEFLR
ncbi:MAG: hypothetical protein R3C02_20385 [Planctomycetaceae bacterium]